MRRHKGKDHPTSWPRVHLNCVCKGGNTVSIGTKALAKYDEAKGDERVIRCGECKTWAKWEVVEDEEGR